MRRKTIASLIALWVTGCDGEGPIEPQSALGTSYDNSSSSLGAENVQDAIDELAGRPVPEAPLRDRLYFTPWVVRTELAAPNLAMDGDCGQDLLISMSCDFQGSAWPSSSATPVLTASYVDGDIPGATTGHCRWSTHDGLIPSGTFRARALCLRL